MKQYVYRTHNCGELNIKDLGKNVILSGWIHQIRNFGSLSFLDLRDYFGITQLIILKKFKKKNLFLGKEALIRIKGEVRERSSKNKKISTGEIEILVNEIKILNKSIPIPFLIEDHTDGKEEDRMIYRYLDIRRNIIKNNLILRHKISLDIRNFLSKKGFLEIETPMLINSTPEGARNFVVPSRKQKGKFYSLPQSPQIFKQLLMIGGIDKYFQIVKCFRDEDARSDRQIEFTQIDCEMSFVKKEDVLLFFEIFIKYIFSNFNKNKLDTPFPRLSYCDAIKMYGTDSPDIRFGMKFFEIDRSIIKKNIKELIDNKLIIGIKTDVCDYIHDHQIDKLLKIKDTTNFFWIKYLSDGNIIHSKKGFLYKKKFIKNFVDYLNIKRNDLLIVSYGEEIIARKILSQIRTKILKKFCLKKHYQSFQPVWILDFPLLEWEKKEKKFKSLHHPFTSPKEEDIHLLNYHPNKVRSQSYDLIINGIEIGSGSIRIHNKEIQNIIFKHIGLSSQEIKSNFGFFLKAFEYGTPPHGGIAFGLDRLISLLKNDENIKNFIAFPKNNEGKDLMTNSPSYLKTINSKNY
ncbi:aspartate--tRNA ligase [Blattabacterium cuenoti]|uniref:aspartate--tRNA ligase n=1 Tax=Blattabacterium cuenoti TaxID=1653831 RepID=UPI00163C98E6|nr:aspartate--tRNA ligase [Blattabacterium cuenoti]